MAWTSPAFTSDRSREDLLAFSLYVQILDSSILLSFLFARGPHPREPGGPTRSSLPRLASLRAAV